MNSTRLIDLCQRIRPELACLGELGRPLLDVVTVIERVGAARDIIVLSEPGFALDVLTAAGADSDAASVGRVLDFLRIRANAGPPGTIMSAADVTLVEAVEMYEAGGEDLAQRPLWSSRRPTSASSGTGPTWRPVLIERPRCLQDVERKVSADREPNVVAAGVTDSPSTR